MPKAFVAYPESPAIITDTIAGAVGLSVDEDLKLLPWQTVQIYGLKIDALIRESLDECDVLIADITVPNFNVYYEIGYALGKKKPVLPILNLGLESAKANALKIGIFDNTGWLEYANSDELSVKLRNWKLQSWQDRFEKPRNHAHPLFILDLQTRTNFRNYIFQSVVDRHVQHRTYDPLDSHRLTASQAIADISSSAGVILPLLSTDMADHEASNLRAAFLAGLAHGYDIDALIIQYGNGPAPLDYRDYVTNTASRKETVNHVEDYCAKVLIRNQASSNRSSRFEMGFLNRVDLGKAAAENESLTLYNYFVETAEYLRALRAETAIISGRKGSGKTAILVQVAEQFARNRENLVIQLRPSTHNLSELRESLLSVVNQGVFDHTIAAFWQYLLYMEILLAVRERALGKAGRSFELQKRVIEIEEKFSLSEDTVSGDFTSRLSSAISDLVEALSRGLDSIQRMTNILYEQSIPKLRECICSFGDMFDQVILLIDDLDKGWPPQQLENQDVRTIRHLFEAIRRIDRDLSKHSIPFKSLLFLRGDVYEHLVEQTSDRGKYNIISVDWTSREQLVNLLKSRVTAGFESDDQSAQAWEAVNPVLSDGRFAVDHMIQASLWRPRFLIEACEKILSASINNGSAFVTDTDVEDGLVQMSRYLVSDLGFELRDISGTPEGIFYAFIGKPELLTIEEVSDCLVSIDIGEQTEKVIELLLWYGFLGVINEQNAAIFIFDRGYDFRRLMAERPKKAEDVLYTVNQAFLRGLRP